MMTLKAHQIADRHFDALAAGYGDEPALTVLIDGQLSRRKLLLRALIEELSELAVPHEVWDRFERAWELLDEIEAETPDAVTGPDGVLRHPYFGVWAMSCLRELIGGRDSPQALERIGRRLGYFSAVVAVAAARAGRELELEVVMAEGGLALPMLGRLNGFPAGTVVRLCVRAGEVTARGPEHSVVEVADETRELAGGVRPIRLEDTDPFRDAFGYPVGERLGPAAAGQWAQTFAAAWHLIAVEHRPYLPGLATGLSSITPLAAQPSGAEASAASRHAFGALGSVLPATPARLAVLLIHEFQHVKLGALLDLVPLLDDSDGRLYHAPWRPDPRPLPALLQGTYAHLAVTDFWRRHRHEAGSIAETQQAEERFSHWRGQTATVIDVMLDSTGLTAAGHRFVSGMAATIAPWLDEKVSHLA
jgi:uncharacterized protein